MFLFSFQHVVWEERSSSCPRIKILPLSDLHGDPEPPSSFSLMLKELLLPFNPWALYKAAFQSLSTRKNQPYFSS